MDYPLTDAYHGPYHGPYNKLLCTLFPADTDFSVFPRYELSSEEAPVRFFLDVLYDNKPVFILEHRAPQEMIRFCTQRDRADLQLRQRIEDLRPECPLPVLHAVSAFGTKLCFYKMHRDQPIQPSFIPNPESVRDLKGTAPQKWWDCNVLQKEGEKRFKSMVEEIKQACATL